MYSMRGTALKDGKIVTNGGACPGRDSQRSHSERRPERTLMRLQSGSSLKTNYMRHDIGKAIDEA